MRVITAVALACTMLLLASCSSSSTKGTGGSAKAKEGSLSNKDLLVGRWEVTEGKDKGEIMEFTKDGKMKMEQGKIVMEGTYKFVDDNNIEVAFETMMGEKLPADQNKPMKLKVEVAQDLLTLTGGPKGEAQKLKRVK